ncbi:hypothetical protein K505DRAFT_12081 [Melanomma pulvis-pyrius CBS 109.77]|uniref:Secreted protein n=1 Tax=Melanomma pulvis-pyrius CBS 109.77 TaxID=1314802 RepID=A0A6A6XUR6_9PLEO|nr:hypothetical protein K505DRAFT_12081 [Melanomma pulvis-pyrius CBS 109.77]
MGSVVYCALCTVYCVLRTVYCVGRVDVASRPCSWLHGRAGARITPQPCCGLCSPAMTSPHPQCALHLEPCFQSQRNGSPLASPHGGEAPRPESPARPERSNQIAHPSACVH